MKGGNRKDKPSKRMLSGQMQNGRKGPTGSGNASRVVALEQRGREASSGMSTAWGQSLILKGFVKVSALDSELWGRSGREGQMPASGW